MPDEFFELDNGVKIPILKTEEKAWLACAIDSEGSIIFPIDRRRNPNTVQLSIQVANTDINYIQYASKLLGKKYKTRKPRIDVKRGINTSKPIHVVIVYGVHAQRILEQIESYLLIKRNLAIKGMGLKIKTLKSHLQIINSKPHRRNPITGKFI